jgi:hypothetical protein
MLQFSEGKFHQNLEMTIGVEFGSKYISIDEVPIKLQIVCLLRSLTSKSHRLVGYGGPRVLPRNHSLILSRDCGSVASVRYYTA